MRFEDPRIMLQAMRDLTGAGSIWSSDEDDPFSRSVGFSDGEVRLDVPMSSVKLAPDRMRELLRSPSGRRSLVRCVNHGHGLSPDDLAGCALCRDAAVVTDVMES